MTSTRVVLTHPEPRVERIADALRARGHEVAVLATRRLVPLQAMAGLASRVGASDWAVFVSPGAVDAALDLLDDHWPDGVGIAVIGPGSVQALAARGIAPPRHRIVVPSAPPFDADALLAQPPFDAPAGLRVVVLRGERGRTDWIERLRGLGADVDALSIYRAEEVAPAPAALELVDSWCRAGEHASFVFSSADGIASAQAALLERGCLDWARGQRSLAVHPRLVQLLRDGGWRHASGVAPGQPALVAALESP